MLVRWESVKLGKTTSEKVKPMSEKDLSDGMQEVLNSYGRDVDESKCGASALL